MHVRELSTFVVITLAAVGKWWEYMESQMLKICVHYVYDNRL